MALYLVTGGAGFIGSHIAEALLARGDRVRVLDDLSGGSRANFQALGHDPQPLGSGAPIELLVGSVADAGAARRACEGVAGVFHEAALVSVPRSVERPDLAFETNVKGTFELLEAARAAGVGKLVFASSAAIYGRDERLPKEESMAPAPASPYAGDKLTGETMLAVWGRTYGLRTVALRYFNVFGPRQADDSPYSGVIAVFAKRCLEGERVRILGDGGQTRDFVYVGDVARANLLAMDAELEPGAVFNVGTGSSITILQLAEAVGRLIPGGEAPEHGPEREGDVRHSRASIERIRGALGYEPGVHWEDGLARTVAWYRERDAAAREAAS